jgi:dihydrofolate reductase
MINIIVAMSNNFVIGKNNTLPWHLPTDLKYFKDTTNSHTVVMGRKCWESIPENYRPLPNRKNIVLSRNKDYVAKGATVINDLEQILSSNESNHKQIFIIGGAELYKEAFKYANKLFLTQIFQDVDGDITLEGLISKDWCLYEGSEIYEENGFKFRFELYQKNNKKDCF